MTKIDVVQGGKRVSTDVIATVAQPTVPVGAPIPDVGLVEISTFNPTELIPGPRGSMWWTGNGPPADGPDYVEGDMYLDNVSEDVWRWTSGAWVNTGTNISGSPDTGGDILIKLDPVDGAGSGLDADFLDGQHGSYYASAAALAAEVSDRTAADTNLQNQITSNTSNIALKANIASPVFTGNPTAPTPTAGDNDTSIATTAFVTTAVAGKLDSSAAATTYAPIASPTFTGDPKAPTPATTDNDTSVATTAFVKTVVAAAPVAPAATSVDSTTDWDTIVTPGYYDKLLGTGNPHHPLSGHYFYCFVLFYAGGQVTQIAYPYGASSSIAKGIYYRGRYTGTWTSWVHLVEEAPSDSLTYGRKNGAWATVVGGATTDDNPPAGPLQDGQLWWRSSDGKLFIWYDDGNSTQWVEVTGVTAPGGTASSENLIFNPAFLISQENGIAASSAAGYYIADQWTATSSGLGTHTAASASEGSTGRYYGHIRNAAAQASVPAASYIVIQQPIEGIALNRLRWGSAEAIPAMLRFKAQAIVAGTYSVTLKDATGSYSFSYDFALPAGGGPGPAPWIDIAIPIPKPSGGTWNLTSAAQTAILQFVHTVGSTYKAPASGVWNAGNFIGGPGIGNNAATANNYFFITEVGLYADPNGTGVAPPFVVPDFASELVKCQRYWESSYPPGSPAGTVTSSGITTSPRSSTAATDFCTIPYKVQKRIAVGSAPSSVYSYITGASGNIRDDSAGVDVAVSAVTHGYNNVRVSWTAVVGHPYSIHWVCNARML